MWKATVLVVALYMAASHASPVPIVFWHGMGKEAFRLLCSLFVSEFQSHFFFCIKALLEYLKFCYQLVYCYVVMCHSQVIAAATHLAWED